MKHTCGTFAIISHIVYPPMSIRLKRHQMLHLKRPQASLPLQVLRYTCYLIEASHGANDHCPEYWIAQLPPVRRRLWDCQFTSGLLRKQQRKEHTELIVCIGIWRLHGIVITLLVTLHRNLVFQPAASFSGVGVVADTTRNRWGIIFLFILIFRLSFEPVRHFAGLYLWTFTGRGQITMLMVETNSLS